MKKNIISKLEGPIFTVYTSFTESGNINYEEIESYLKFLFENSSNPTENSLICRGLPKLPTWSFISVT